MSDVFRFLVGRGAFEALVDASDADLVSRHAWMVMHGHKDKLYAFRTTRYNGVIYMHRLISNTPAGLETDHVNGNGLDNRRCNLRWASASQNRANSGKPRPQAGRMHSSQYKGVSWHAKTNKWQACIKVAGRGRSIGLFESELDAARAYDLAAIQAWGEFAYANLPAVGE